MRYNLEDTIVAIATPVMEASIGIIRVSGKNTFEIMEKVFFPKSGRKLSEYDGHSIVYGEVKEGGEVIDDGLALVFKAPKSYTGEDMVELSLHGNPLILRKVLELIMANGARLAEPGEFTMRAYINGKMDLTQAEAVNEIITAKTELTLKTARIQLQGKLKSKLQELRKELISIMAHIEVRIDHMDEQDVEPDSISRLRERIIRLKEELEGLVRTSKVGEALVSGLRVAIVGRTNAGKSSLLNSLLGSDRAIVSEIHGTTRDLIIDWANFKGVPVALMDTAGIREAEDIIEAEGINRTWKAINDAHIVIYVIDSTAGISNEDIDSLRKILGLGKSLLIVLNKIDITDSKDIEEQKAELLQEFKGARVIEISAKERKNIDEVVENIVDMYFSGALAGKSFEEYLSNPIITTVRQERLVREAIEALEESIRAIDSGMGEEVIAIGLQSCARALGEITGEITVEDILTEIFSNFCIGK